MSSTAYDPLTDLVPKGVRFYGLPRPQHDDYFYWNGRLIIYEFPDRQARYTIGVDCAGGVGADRSVVEVLKVGTVDYPTEHVAEFASDRHGPIDMAEIAAAIGRMYSGHEDEALAIVELNSAGGGANCQSDMRFKWGYNNLYLPKMETAIDVRYAHSFGWASSPGKRRNLVYRGTQAFNSGDLVVNSGHLIEEMRDFRPELYDAKAAAASGKHDDRVMALFMAYLAAHEDEWLTGENVARARRTLTAVTSVRSTEAAAGPTAPKPRRDWQNTPISATDMWHAWDTVFDED